MSNDTHRLFVAIPIPEDLKVLISEKINSLHLPLKFIPAENFHITILFMGNVSKVQMEESKVVLENISKELSGFSLQLDSIISKCNRHQHMLWVSFMNSPMFVECATKITEGLGFKLTRKPLPHVNLIRSKKKIHGDFPLKLDTVKFEVNSIELWKSALSPKGSTYSSLGSFPLKGM